MGKVAFHRLYTVSKSEFEVEIEGVKGLMDKPVGDMVVEVVVC